MDYRFWIKKAIEHIEDLETGTTFELKNLFQGHAWETLTAGERKSFGRYFSNEVRDNRVPQVARYQPEGKGNNKYIKQ